MSDLLPLVAAALNDKVAVDAQKEIDELRNKLEAAYAVEVIHKRRDLEEDEEELDGPNNGVDEDEVVVYYSAPFQNGKYGRNPLYWEVALERNASHVCLLRDLREYLICVGGGFPLTGLDEHAHYEGWLDEDDSDGDACKSMNIHFYEAGIWIDILVQGWPREAWEAKIQADDLNANECIDYLAEVVTDQYPDATVEFTKISFNSKHVHPAMKRLLPPRLREEAQAEVDGRVDTLSNEEQDLISFATTTLRSTNPSAGSALFGIYQREIFNALARIGIRERSDENDQLVTALVNVRVAGGVSGRENFDELVERLVQVRAGETSEENGE